MTSQVNPNNIDGTYPVAGQDNDSQGFRDNFTNIKTNFTFAQSEISDLQAKAVLKSALNNTTLNNDMTGATLANVRLTAYSETVKDYGTQTPGAMLINIADGNYQKLKTGGGAITLSFTGWPALGVAGKLTLEIYVSYVTDTIVLPAQVNLGFPSELAGLNGSTLSFPQVGYYFYELSTTDAGGHIFMEELGRAPSKVQGNLSVTGNLAITNNVTASSNVTITGTLVTSGGRVENGYQYAGNVAEGFSVTIQGGKSRVIFDTDTTRAGGNVILPNTTVDGTVIAISTVQQITAFYANTQQTGTVVRPSNVVVFGSGTGIEYLYHASENAWYKTR